MIKRFISLIILFGLICCNSQTDCNNYFGQTAPNTTPEIFAQGLISLEGRYEHGLSFTPDGNELAFGILDKDNFSGAIFYSKNEYGKWTIPENFAPLKNRSVYLPYFSPNGESLLFTQSKSDTAYHYKDIWIIMKNNKIWSNPKKMNINLPLQGSVSNACMTLDETVYFSSNINCIGIDNCHTADLFYSKKTNNEYQNIEELTELNSQYDEESIFISPNKEYLISCRFTDYNTWMDLYISYPDINNKWIEAQIIDSTINSTNWDRRPFVSFDNKYLFFTRLQIGEKGLTESDIYWVNTQKVFKPYVFNQIPDTIVKIGNEIKIPIPTNYFKDFDNEELEIKLSYEKYDWVKFDEKNWVLTMIPIKTGSFDLIFSAIDNFSNKTEDKFTITVVD